MDKIHDNKDESRVEFDEDSNNGMILSDHYIPAELLIDLMCNYIDEKTLLSCQRVCKRWNILITDFVWHKKAERKSKTKFPQDDKLTWKDYYLIYAKNLFIKNLLKNHSGEEGLSDHWNIVSNGGDRWIVECPPVGAPSLPEGPEFENKEHCFVTSFTVSTKEQVIDLYNEGFTANILDHMQPPIEINEWCCARFDCPAEYQLKVILEKETGEKLKQFKHRYLLEHDTQNVWCNIRHTFVDYGAGVSRIRFIHGGRDRLFWAGHYGSKMAGAYVKVRVPGHEVYKFKDEGETEESEDEDNFSYEDDGYEMPDEWTDSDEMDS